ncbi:MAG: FGGY-family carbohydrate kinase, partial [Arthrobacter sp.]
AQASLHGMTLANYTPVNLARAAFEGVACSLADAFRAVTGLGIEARRVILVGGGARSAAMQQTLSSVLGMPVDVPEPGEYVADGAARQAAAVLTGAWPEWKTQDSLTVSAPPAPEVLERYQAAAQRAYGSTS